MDKNYIEEILTKLKINPYDFNHDEMESVEIDLDDELLGKIRLSEKHNENPFDYICLSDYENGKKSIYFSTTNFEERDLRNLVDEYSSYFGEDWIFKSKFDTMDLTTYRTELSDSLRTWIKPGYKIVIGYSKKYSPKILVGVYEQ